MINVPSGVWIDEQGKIVRPPEVAYSRRYEFGEIVAGDDRYAQGLRDWVLHGTESAFVVPPRELAEKLAHENADRPAADVHFQLAAWLHENGRAEEAVPHWREAQRLAPDNWNYHRQEWSFDPQTRGAKFRAKYETLDGAPYYPPAELPEEATTRSND